MTTVISKAGKRDASIQTDQARKTVLVVGKDDSVVAKPVSLGATVNGLRIIRAGLNPGDKVVIAGMQGAIPGSKVSPHAGTIAPDAAANVPDAETPVPAQATFAR